MHGQELFFQAFIYLSAALVAVPLAKRLGLGSVLGYLLAGVAIGPFGLRLVGEEGQDVLHFAEFGVVMMLFLIGLELEPSRVWRLRVPILGLGGAQVGATAAAIMGVGVLVGVPWRGALAIGLVLALSSTAIVLQTLAEKGLMPTAGGRSSFAVLLFQDIAVIPILAVLPLLVAGRGSHAGSAEAHPPGWVEGLPGWGRTLAVLGAVGIIVLAGRYAAGPALRLIARARLRELFTAAGLLLVIGIALLMSSVGLSPALGTFLAGVVLANSEFRHQLESDVEPFKGLLLGLFFISVGAAVDFQLVLGRPAVIGGLVVGLMLGKLVLLLILGRLFGLSLDQRLLFAFALAQGGEFAFVLFSFATKIGAVDSQTAGLLIAVVALTMALTPLLMIVNERLLLPRVGTREREVRESDVIDEESPVILAGFGRFGQIVGRLLAASEVKATLLDHDSDEVDLARRFGHRVFYGDATRVDLLRAAGAESARLLVIALDDPQRNLELARCAAREFPHLVVLARAHGRGEAYDLLDAGVAGVYRETFGTALELGRDALRHLGAPGYSAQRLMQRFRRHDEEMLREMAAKRHGLEEGEYVSLSRQRIADIESTLRADLDEEWRSGSEGWDTDSLRRELGQATADDEEH